MERFYTCAVFAVGLFMSTAALSVTITSQGADAVVLICGALGFVALIYSMMHEVRISARLKAALALLSLAIPIISTCMVAQTNPPRAMLVSLPISLSISLFSLALFLDRQ